MLTVISPAKKLDTTPWTGARQTAPAFADRARELVGIACNLSVSDLQKLMHISENLARLNVDRFRDFTDEAIPETAKPALFSFAGDTYTGLEAASLDTEEVAYAQSNLRILSGLYGILRPLDVIQPYRLEMGSRLKTPRGKSLYEYWGSTIADALNEQAVARGTDILVNCASQEYFGAVDRDALTLRVITPVFYENKPGGPKIVSFFAKKARGAMARFIIQNRLTDADALTGFDTGGYVYQANLSSRNKPVFLRSEEAAKAA